MTEIKVEIEEWAAILAFCLLVAIILILIHFNKLAILLTLPLLFWVGFLISIFIVAAMIIFVAFIQLLINKLRKKRKIKTINEK